MTGTSTNALLILVPLLGMFTALFVYSRDLVQKQLALFIASYIIFVVFSQYLFGLQFSQKAFIGSFGVDAVSPKLAMFWICFYLASKIGLGRVAIDAPPLCKPGGKTTTGTTIVLALPLILFFMYFVAKNGVRVTGAFMDYRGERSVITDYMFVYYAALVSHYRNSRLLLAVGLFAAASHVLAGERLRAFVYIILMLINYFRMDTRRHFSTAVLLFGFFVATLIGQLRTGSAVGNQSYNITHFGSVTVSSLYLLDFGSTLDSMQRLQFLLGTFLSNLVPSSLVPEDYNIRKAILVFAAIPGGGWLPVFFSIQAGMTGIVAGGLVTGRLYKWILTRARGQTLLQPAFYAASLVFIATTPRWFMYTPYQILKMPLYAFVLSALIVFLAQQTTNRRPVHER